MARSDFNWVPVHHQFTNNQPVFERSFPIEGNLSPKDDAYLLIQVKSVNLLTHSIKINDQELPGGDIPLPPGSSNAWQLWMEHVPPGYLKSGTNTIRITRQGNDNFEINALVVNWRE